jgi:hypothetical protein
VADLSRRDFLAVAAGAAALGGRRFSGQTPQVGAPALRVQYTTGNHANPLTAYATWDTPEFSDFDTWMLPFPHPFAKINNPGGPDVVVLEDWQPLGWTLEDQAPMQKFLETGKGLVVLHHAVGDNNNWPFWYENVTGGLLNQTKIPGMLESGLRQFPRQTLTPAMDHAIVRDVKPFTLPPDELFYNMWFSPKIQVLLRTNDPEMANVKGTVAWLGVHPTARVVCFQPGHTDVVNVDPRYRHVVHNMVRWAGGKLS